MKKIQNLVLASAAAALLLTGCAEDYKSDFNVNKPESVALAETLNAYDVLKNYTGIRLGAEITSNDALAQNALYSQVLANFNEVTLSDAFSYASIVADNGDIDPSSRQLPFPLQVDPHSNPLSCKRYAA